VTDSTPVRIPPCARAIRPETEHVSMAEETVRYQYSELRVNDLEKSIG
jgi:hypothetical protein